MGLDLAVAHLHGHAHHGPQLLLVVVRVTHGARHRLLHLRVCKYIDHVCKYIDHECKVTWSMVRVAHGARHRLLHLWGQLRDGGVCVPKH